MSSRRGFLKAAGVLTAGIAAGNVACADGTTSKDATASSTGAGTGTGTGAGTGKRPVLDKELLASLGETVLPAMLGVDGQRAAIAAFATWCNEYEPVAEEMHGYGYADVRYLPADPVPAWQAQLHGLELLAQRVHHTAFGKLTRADRVGIVGMATRGARGDRLPAPLHADHVAVALLAHWASSPAAWDRALGVAVAPSTCRALGDATRKPLPIAATGGKA